MAASVDANARMNYILSGREVGSQTISLDVINPNDPWDRFCEKVLNNAKTAVKDGSLANGNDRFEKIDNGLLLVVRILKAVGWNNFVMIVASLAGGVGIAAFGTVLAGATLGPVLLLAGAALGGIAATTYKIYSHREVFIKVKVVLEPKKASFDRLTLELKLRADKYIKHEKNVLFIECVEKVINDIYEKEISINDCTLPVKPVCKCGGFLTPSKAKDLYNLPLVICDACNGVIKSDSEVFHCPKGKVAKHKEGYDICIRCARAHARKLSRYHVLIIEALNSSNVVCNDGKKLEALFKDLFYHNVTLLGSQNATKAKVKQELQKLNDASQTGDNVIVVAFSGHGVIMNNRWVFQLTDGFVSDFDIGKWLLSQAPQDVGADAALYTRDVILLVNACFSGNINISLDARNANFDMYDDKSCEKKESEVDHSELATELARLVKHELNSNEYQQIMQSVNVIAACQSNEEANFIFLQNGVSPFIEYIVQTFTDRKVIEDRAERITSSILYESVRVKSVQKISGPAISLRMMGQNTNQPVVNGSYANEFDLCPIVGSYYH